MDKKKRSGLSDALLESVNGGNTVEEILRSRAEALKEREIHVQPGNPEMPMNPNQTICEMPGLRDELERIKAELIQNGETLDQEH